jgi:hypothetical protein
MGPAISAGNSSTSNGVLQTQNPISNGTPAEHNPTNSEAAERHNPANNEMFNRTARNGETSGAQNAAVQLAQGTVSVSSVVKKLTSINPDSSGVGEKAQQGGRRLEVVGTRSKVKTHATGIEQTLARGAKQVRTRRTQPGPFPVVAVGSEGSPQGLCHSREQDIQDNRRQVGIHNRPNTAVSNPLQGAGRREISRATLDRPAGVKRAWQNISSPGWASARWRSSSEQQFVVFSV